MSFFSKLKEAAGFGESDEEREFWEMMERERQNLEAGKDVLPPWEIFPGKSPVHGWDQGYPYEWKLEIWSPFWGNLVDEQQLGYLERNPPPDEDWRETLLVYWKPRKENV